MKPSKAQLMGQSSFVIRAYAPYPFVSHAHGSYERRSSVSHAKRETVAFVRWVCLLRWGQGVENTSALEAEVESTPCIG